MAQGNKQIETSGTLAPPISVVLITYNHQDYIEESVQSILRQTHREFELIVVDSGSTDNTPKILERINDPRKNVLTLTNRGPSLALNAGIALARGEYIALLSGDDVADPERLSKQWREAKERGVQVVASQVAFCGEAGNEISPPRYLAHLKKSFGTENAPRLEVLLKLLTKGNLLNITTLFASRGALKSIYQHQSAPFNPLLLQLQDLDLWIRLLSLYDYWVIQEPLMKYRVRSNGQNLSAPSETVARRSRTEFFLMLSQLLRNLPPALTGNVDRLIEALLQSPETSHRLAAIEFLFSRPKNEQKMTELEFSKLIGDLSIFHPQIFDWKAKTVLAVFKGLKNFKIWGGLLVDRLRGNR